VLEQEHVLYPQALRIVASGDYSVDGNRVRSNPASGNKHLLNSSQA
jgi:folate-dependent phosphoribosylglycinamide formyltransferase PurN